MSVPSQLLRRAIPLVSKHGFTRQTLSLAGIDPVNSNNTGPLSDTAITALFGQGNEARKTLINAWLEAGVEQMGNAGERGKIDIRIALKQRLEWNTEVLDYLPEAFALLLTPSTFSILDPIPALSHTAAISHRACSLAGDASVGSTWYTRRMPVAAIYGVAELHQIRSPSTASTFLDSLFDEYQKIEDVGEFLDYILRSLKGIVKSRGII